VVGLPPAQQEEAIADLEEQFENLTVSVGWDIYSLCKLY
jgi:hypothetical protein